MLLEAFRALLQFTTVLPIGRPADFRCFARHSWLYPLAGYVIGGCAAVITFFVRDPVLAAAIGIATVILLSGANHFDGLLDLGDALMAHGSPEARIRALTDHSCGAGALTAGVLVTLLAFASLVSLHPFFWAIIVAEVGAKFSMAAITACGTPFREGLHATLHAGARPYFPLCAAALCIPILFFPLSPARAAATIAAMVLVPVLVIALGNRLFGGVNGDLTGASNEVTRAAILLAMAVCS